MCDITALGFKMAVAASDLRTDESCTGQNTTPGRYEAETPDIKPSSGSPFENFYF